MLAVYAAGERGARAAARDGAAVVVVDAFRASTTIAVLVKKGVRVVPVASIDEALAYDGADYRIGERGSKKARGFDFGNSPTEVEAAELAPDATVVLSTTNGTRIVEASRKAPAVFAGAFVNARAVADELAARMSRRVAVIGCGWQGRRASEDESAAGAILHRLKENGLALDERAQRTVESYLTRSRASLRKNSAARRLVRLGYEEDIDFCLAEDTVAVVPRLEGEAFVARRLARRPNEGGSRARNVRQKSS